MVNKKRRKVKMRIFRERILAGEFVQRVGVGGYECEACSFWAGTKKKIIEHQKTCEFIGYLEDIVVCDER